MNDQFETMEQLLTKQAFINQKPITATIELLPLCNMNCDMCYVRLSPKEMENEGKLLTIQQWISIAKQLQQSGILFLLITGGEPLLYPKFKELYIELKKMGFIITLNTNGTLLNDKWISVFKQYKPRRINITLYGSNNDTYEKLCHYPNGFTYTINTIIKLIENNIPLKINGSLVKYNRNELDDLYQICNSYHIPIHIDTYMIPSIKQSLLKINKGTRLSPIEMAYAEIRVLKNELPNKEYESYVKSLVKKLQNPSIYPDTITCQAANTSFAINWKGFMLPCISMKGISINLLETTVNEGWQYITKKAKQLKIDAKCTTCTFRPICKNCVASAYLETNKYNQAPSYLCDYSKTFAQLLINEYHQINENEAS